METPVIYIFARDLNVSGRTYRQNVAVYADDTVAARGILDENLAKWKRPKGKPAGSEIPGAYEASGEWRSYAVRLDAPKVVSAIIDH